MAINNPVVADADIIQDTAVAIQEKDRGGKMEYPNIPSRIRAVPTGVSPIFEQIINQTATDIVASIEVKHLLAAMFSENDSVIGVILNSNPLSRYARNPARSFDNCHNLKFVILPHLKAETNNSFGNYVFLACTNLKIVILNTMGASPEGNVYNGANNLSNLVLVSNARVSLSNTITFANSPISQGVCNLYVPDSLKEDYKAATNWSVYANQFKEYSEAPIYNAITAYTIGDLCKNNGRC